MADGPWTTPHSTTLAWKIPWTEEPGRLPSMGSLELDTTERLHFQFSLSCIGKGNGNPLQCSCLENPRDGKPGGLPSMGSHRVGHDWNDLAAAAAVWSTDHILGSNDLDSPAYQHKFLPDRFIQTKVTTGLFCSKIFKANLTLGLNLWLLNHFSFVYYGSYSLFPSCTP